MMYKKRIHSILALLVLAYCILLFPVTVAASSTDAIPYVSDVAALFNEAETTNLAAKCEEINQNNAVHAIILTISGTDLSRKEYLENYYDANKPQLSDAVLLLLNMDPEDRGVEIQGYGSCEYTISDDRIETMISDMMPALKEGDYYGAMLTYLSDVDVYINTEPTTNYTHTEADNQAYNESHSSNTNESFARKSLRNLLIALVLGGLSVGLMGFRSSGRMTANQATYLDQSNSRVLGKYDHYIKTTTTRVPKPKPPKDNGGGFSVGGGVSSGGSSHSGGGSSF